MRLFQQIIAEHTCSERCGYHCSVRGPMLSWFHGIAALIATVGLWVFPLHALPPWYCFFGVLSGELLLIYLAGIPASILVALLSRQETRKCLQCGAPMFFAGRHFDPAGTSKPLAEDILLFAIFAGATAAVWRFLVNTGF